MKRLFTLLPVLFLVGCTITKRHFGPGYHVEWKKSNSAKEAEFVKENRTCPEENNHEPSHVNELLSDRDSIKDPNTDGSIMNPTDADVKTSSEGSNAALTEAQSSQIQTEKNRTNQDDLPVDEVKKKTEPLTWVALILLVGIGIAAGLISMYSSFLYLGAGIFLAGLAIVIFILSLISLIRIYRYPERYKNKWLTKFVFFLTVLSLVAAGICMVVGVSLQTMDPMIQGI